MKSRKTAKHEPIPPILPDFSFLCSEVSIRYPTKFDMASIEALEDDVYVLPASHSITPPITAAISILGSYIILREAVADHRRRKGQPISRVLIAMSVSDIIFSIGLGLSTFVAPADLDYIWGNAGTKGTCELQGFLIQFGLVAGPLFNAMLSFFHVLVVKYRYTDAQLGKLEGWFHAVIWTFTLASSSFPLSMGLYNNACDICWLESYPLECKDSFTYGDEGTCTRGDNAWLYALVYSFFPSWVCIILSIFFMVVLCLAVRETENASLKYAGSIKFVKQDSSRRSSSNSKTTAHALDVSVDSNLGDEQVTQRVADRTRSRTVALQAFWYIMAFLAAHTLWTIAKIIWFSTKEWNEKFYLVAYNVMLPLQGFFNCLVFIRLREMVTPEGRLFRRIFCALQKPKESKKRRLERARSSRRNAPPPVQGKYPRGSTSSESSQLDSSQPLDKVDKHVSHCPESGESLHPTIA